MKAKQDCSVICSGTSSRPIAIEIETAVAVALEVADKKIALLMTSILATGRHAMIASIGFVLRIMLLVVVPFSSPHHCVSVYYFHVSLSCTACS